ncbi:hypothetical protein ACDX66_08125 [Peribacillus frigoritolerans]
MLYIRIKDSEIISKCRFEDLRESSGKPVVGGYWEILANMKEYHKVASEKSPRLFFFVVNGFDQVKWIN